MPDDDQNAEFIKRFESYFEFIVRDLDEALCNSHHAKFAAAIADYAKHIDNLPEQVDKAYVESLLRALLEVAARGLNISRELLSIPQDSDDDLDQDVFRMDYDAQRALEAKINLIFEKPIAGISKPDDLDSSRLRMLGDDLVDLYNDLVPGLRCWEMKAGSGIGEAIFCWNLMPSHWNYHLFGAMKSLDEIRFHGFEDQE